MKNLSRWQVSEVKLQYSSRIKITDSPQIKSSDDAARIFWQNWSDDLDTIESFNILLLNRANRVKGMFTVSKGGISGTVVDARVIFAVAVKALTCSIILSHNHPSGNITPSQADINLTQKLKKAGEVLDIQILDHLILTTEDFYSFADEGII